MSTDRKPFEPSIPALWFTAEGLGPDLLAIQLQPFPSEMDGRIPASLGLRILPSGEMNLNADFVGGGFTLHREQVELMHRQLGEWLGRETAQTAADGPPIVDIVFDGAPGPARECCFVEVEDGEGNGLSYGRWIERADGFWVLRIKEPAR